MIISYNTKKVNDFQKNIYDNFVAIDSFTKYANTFLLPYPEKKPLTKVGGSVSEAGKKANTSRVKVARGVLPLTVTR